MSGTKSMLVIPVFIPHSGCPHRCAFCNQTYITSETGGLPSLSDIRQTVTKFLEYKGDRREVQLAFFGGNFLGLSRSDAENYLNFSLRLKKEKMIDSVRFSTRPDTITPETLDMIRDFPVSTIEIGAQSMNDHVLKLAQRGHTAYDTVKAAQMIKEKEFSLGIQMMTGLPKDSEESCINTAEKIIRICPDFVRIYPLIVLKGSRIAKWYKNGEYTPPSLDRSVKQVKTLYKLFADQNIPVIRMGLQASDMFDDPDLAIAGPWHPAFGHLVLSEVMFDKAEAAIRSHLERHPEETRATLQVHPASESRLRGNKNGNLNRLKGRFPALTIRVEKDESLGKETVKLTE
ncbi:MAG: radical SAM protein [Desulfobacteraceae bacterium]